MINPARILGDTWIGRVIRAPLALLGPDRIVRILQGPARGCRWRVGAGVHGYWVGTYEPLITKAFAALVTPASVVWDVGAHAGYYTIVAAARGARVHAFEPWPPNCAQIEQHVALNGFGDRVTVHRVAAGAATGEGLFEPGECSPVGRLSPRGVPVPVVALDSLRLEPPTLIKMDVEGAEADALRGMDGTLQSAHPVLFVATHTPELAAACERALSARGYRIEHPHPQMILATPWA